MGATASIPCHIGRARCPLKCRIGRPPTSWSTAVLRAAVCEEDAVSRGWWADRWGQITSTDARLLICSAGSQMSNVHHRHHTFSTTYLNSPCGWLPVPKGVPRKFILLPREPRNLQSRSRLYRGIFLNFNPDPAGNPAGHSCSRSRAKLYTVRTVV